MIRAFLAVELSQELRSKFDALQQELKRRIESEIQRDARISWVQPAKIHLTIKFLGDMDEQVIDLLSVAVERAIGSQTAVNLPLERLGAFPRSQNPKVLWVGPWKSEDAVATRPNSAQSSRQCFVCSSVCGG